MRSLLYAFSDEYLLMGYPRPLLLYIFVCSRPLLLYIFVCFSTNKHNIFCNKINVKNVNPVYGTELFEPVTTKHESLAITTRPEPPLPCWILLLKFRQKNCWIRRRKMKGEDRSEMHRAVNLSFLLCNAFFSLHTHAAIILCYHFTENKNKSESQIHHLKAPLKKA